MISSNIFNRIKTMFAVIAGFFLVFVGCIFMVAHSALAETSLSEYDGFPPPPPSPAACVMIANQAFEAAMSGGAYDELVADYWQCMKSVEIEGRLYEKDLNDYWRRRQDRIAQSWQFKLKTAMIGGFLDTISYMTTNFAYDMANYILGVDGPEDRPKFYEDGFGDWLEYHGNRALGVFIERFDAINEYSADLGSGQQTKLGLGLLCKKPSPLDVRLGLFMGDALPLNHEGCTWTKLTENFEAIADMVDSEQALKIHREPFKPSNNDLSVGLEMHSNYIDAFLSEQTKAKLSRLESEGMRPITDFITQRIKWPSVSANESARNMEPIMVAMRDRDRHESYMIQTFLETGLEGVVILTVSTFFNRLIFGFLDKILNPKPGPDYASGDTTKYSIIFGELGNVDATGEMSNYFERQAFAKSLGDFIIPSFFSQEDKDLITELSVCPPLRSKWNCTMDQVLATAIRLGTREGALTVGKASGVGSENTTFSAHAPGLNPNWELIPEIDIVNNTDPSCYLRAYCAGNLKKLRLARILPIGFEMAANSPYNIKHNGKYVTLGTVINGYYDCNDKGMADKDHPWCHLIDPNWILTAPRYQCRTKGYGDTIMPEIGTRQEECGDMATCLGTNQSGECEKGYGYCLAERPVYKFSAPECSEQYASCRTYVSSQGQSLSALRYTLERGACSEESIGCMWYALDRYVTSTASPDGLWVGTLTQGPRVYLDGGVEPCSAEGCVKAFEVKAGSPALNLINNSSFEQIITEETSPNFIIRGFTGWNLVGKCNAEEYEIQEYNEKSYFGGNSLKAHKVLTSSEYCQKPSGASQEIKIGPNRNYTLSMYVRAESSSAENGAFFYVYRADDPTKTPITIPAVFEQCSSNNTTGLVSFDKNVVTENWSRQVCQFVSPNQEDLIMSLTLRGEAYSDLYYDGILLEEGEYVNDYIETVASGLNEAYIKIAPDEYSCTGNDEIDHPSCKNFARVCRETEVGCQGYQDVEDPSSPEIPAILSPRDYCPSICAGYGEYRKLASAFDLVEDLVHPQFNDPDDKGTSYIIPGQAQSCSVQDIGCEPFTNMSSAVSGGEQVSYFNYLRSCQLPNELSRTYFTWEGSDLTGYELRTWALISESETNHGPKILIKGAQYGDIKDSISCNEDLWKSGVDPDCRQFYDEDGAVYYRYYSQTVSSDSACTLFRKDDSTATDCAMTGGHEFVAQSGSCMYYVLPSQSSFCPAHAGGCRAYMGPTGRNAVQIYYETFLANDSLAGYQSTAGSSISRSEESVLVGDYSLKINSESGSPAQVERTISINSTSTLYRISFWVKALNPGDASVSINGQAIGTFHPNVVWQRFEFGPFQSSITEAVVSISASNAVGTLFIDTIKIDQLNDVRFLVKNSWTIPAACDTTPEGTPEPRAMLGCREYSDRDGNQIFAKSFSSLCRADSIGCKAFVDTRGMPRPYSETRTISGSKTQSQRNDGDARTYENQYIGDWSVTSPAWRYYYAIDDYRARCDASQNSCRAFGKPVFTQDRLSLESTDYNVDPQDTIVLQNQNIIYEFQTVLLKHDWDAYYKSDTSLNLACRKDELHCDRFLSGNVTEYFRNPGEHACEWREGVALNANPSIGIYSNSTFSGWFRVGTDIPCYPGNDFQSPPKSPYLKGGDTFGAYFTAEDPYSGWVSHCPVNQSECTEFIDPNDTSDPSRPFGRSYFLINSRQIDTRSCGALADPLSGCVLFNSKNIGDMQANSKATYQKSMDERGAPQTPIDCNNDPENPYCKVCVNFVLKDLPSGSNALSAGEVVNLLQLNPVNTLTYAKQLMDYELKLAKSGASCESDLDCVFYGQDIFAEGAIPDNFKSFAVGTCGRTNDSNVVIKVQLDRECARWMGCRTSETVYDPTQQKLVNQCSELELCEKSGSRNEDIFCSRFTNREAEDLLSKGQFINLENYSSRRIGYGAMDYSGYTIPNQYLLPDIKVRAVGTDIMPTADLREKYKLDNRLVAEISMSNPNIIEVDDPASGSSKICRDHVLVSCNGSGCESYEIFVDHNLGTSCTSDADCSEFLNISGGYEVRGKCGLTLCKDIRTGRLGYIDGIKNVCVLAINEPQAISSSVSASAKDLSRDISNIYNYYMDDNISARNTALQSFMPAPECQLYPEASSPLPNEYVEIWNMSSKPPIPLKMISGYEGAKACVYGEDCSCSYRKVRYSMGADQYYSVNGQAPSIGVCVGGKTPGKACVPNGYVPVNSNNELLVSMKVDNKILAEQACDGGICRAIQDVVVLNGRYGYCLERDKSRVSSSNQISAPCLTWSPQNVIGGQYDVTHYSPTASYLPPQGSGEYYCTSGANEQTLKTPRAESWLDWYDSYLGSWTGPDFWNPGKLRQLGYSRTDVWYYNKGDYNNTAIDGATNHYVQSKPLLDCIKHEEKSGNKANSLRCDTTNLNNVMKAGATQSLRFACRRASVCEGVNVSEHDVKNRIDANPYEGRWIMTGDAISNSYMEYFVPAGPGIWGVDEKYFDYHYGLFKFSLVPDALGVACKWNPKWVGMSHITMEATEGSDFSCSAYLQQIQSNSQQFYNKFSSQFSGVLDRTTETVFQDVQGNPQKMACVLGGGSCYYKFWEVGYQDQGKPKFTWPEKTHKLKLEKFNFKEQFKQYYAEECRSGEPYFSIRAVFQNTNSYTNSLPPEETLESGLEGPWQFVGFWFTTCLNADNRLNDPAWLYMRLDTVSSDVCREVSQVKDSSNQSAPFMDRIWSAGKFMLPTLGLRYDTPNPPFGSSLATGKISTDPLLVGASAPLSGDLQKAPTFIDSGVTAASLFNQQNSWTPLSNLFAKIYKIWRWDPIPVYSWDSACVSGSQKGKLCSAGASPLQGLKECGDYAECNPDIDVGLKNQNWRCNTLSGVNRGLSCGQDPSIARNLDKICHNAARRKVDNPSDPSNPTYEPILSSCLPSEENLATFSIPLADFGNCEIKTSKGGGLFYYYCNEGLSKTGMGMDGASDTDVMHFKMVKCKNKDSYFAYPIKPGFKWHGKMDELLNEINAYDLWYFAYEIFIEAIRKADITFNSAGEAICPEQGASISLTVLDNSPQNFYEALIQRPELRAYVKNELYVEALQGLYAKDNMPRKFDLGLWDENSGKGLIVNTCDSSAVNAGARCETPGDKSPECPTEIAACNSSRYKEIETAIRDASWKKQCSGVLKCNFVEPEYPPCGYCVMNDPKDQYRELYKGTGYCQGFNPLSRCVKNSDCVFSSFEFWGTEDLDGAKGRMFDDESVRFIAYGNESIQIGANLVKKGSEGVSLPMPLFNGKTTVPDQYSYPARIDRIDHGTNYIIYTKAVGVNFIKEDLGCKDPYWANICIRLAEGIVNINEYSSQITKDAQEVLTNCFSDCRRSMQMHPNGYAENFDEIVQATYGTKSRTAAVAPFSVNPQIRNQLSRGYLTVDLAGNEASKFNYWAYYYMGKPIGYAKNENYSNHLTPAEVPPYESVAYFQDNKQNWKQRTNDSFPWSAEKLYFTKVFPLAIEGQYDLPSGYEVHKDRIAYDLYWEGYGMSQKLFEIAQKYFKEKKYLDVAGSQYFQKQFNYIKQAKKDMHDNFFAKTGWGVFMEPSDSRLQLYPGAIPAALPKLADPYYEKYTVYIPGHCEPPIGGTDTDTVQGNLVNIITGNKGEKGKSGIALGYPDSIVSAEKDETLPDFRETADGIIRRSFLMPWQKDKDWITTPYTMAGRGDYLLYEADDYGLVQPDNYTWAQPYVAVDRNVEPTSIPITCENCSPVQTYRNSCRCEGGKLNGTVQESKLDCNLYLPEHLNPDKYTDPNDPAIPILCKPVSDATGNPIPECQAGFGISGHQDPDLDDNSCTHKAGYVPRGDVCADGRDSCLVTYQLNDPVSTNHFSKPESKVAAPSATAVAGGLDTFFFLSGGKTNKDDREYISWYRPVPPKVAAPDTSKPGQAANTLPISMIDTFSINGIPLGLNYFGGGQGLAKIQFYAWTAHDQGPIKSIIIDWGDGYTQKINNAQLKNRKPVCNTGRECEFALGLACTADSDCPPGAGACLETGLCQKQSYKSCFKDEDCGFNDKCNPRMMFGNSSESCQQGYFEFSHIYKCDDEALRNIDVSCDKDNRCENEPDIVCSANSQCRAGESCVSGLAPRGGCYNEVLDRCRFTPRVLIQDNWGWCTGDCSQTNESQPNSAFGDYNIRHPNGGCLDASDTKLNTDVINNPGSALTLPNECQYEVVNTRYRPWVIYQGSVEVGYEGAISNIIKNFNFGGSQFGSYGSILQQIIQNGGSSQLQGNQSSGGLFQNQSNWINFLTTP